MSFTPLPPRNIRNAIKSFIPNWLSDRPGLKWAFSVLFTVALVCDMFVETMFQGVLAPLPGVQGSTSTALNLIGQARGLLRGLLEDDDSYAATLRAWLDIWGTAGSAETLVTQVQRYLGASYTVRLIDRNGNTKQIDPDGTIHTYSSGSWDWDSVSNPERSLWWGDLWLVITQADGRFPVYSSLSDPAWIAAWGTNQGFGTGHQVPRNVVDGLYTIVAAFKSAHVWISAIIWTDDATLFNAPYTAVGLNPDGTWGNWSYFSSSHQHPARLITHSGNYVRYWIPRLGGW